LYFIILPPVNKDLPEVYSPLRLLVRWGEFDGYLVLTVTEYLKKVFERVAGMKPGDDWGQLLPWNLIP
jgi:hypothetical protein